MARMLLAPVLRKYTLIRTPSQVSKSQSLAAHGQPNENYPSPFKQLNIQALRPSNVIEVPAEIPNATLNRFDCSSSTGASSSLYRGGILAKRQNTTDNVSFPIPPPTFSVKRTLQPLYRNITSKPAPSIQHLHQTITKVPVIIPQNTSINVGLDTSSWNVSEVRIPKPNKRQNPVLCDGHYVVPPPPPLQPISQNIIQAPVASNNTVPFHPIKLFTPAVRNFNETTKKDSEANTEFSPVSGTSKSVRTTKLSLNKKNRKENSACVLSVNQGKIVVQRSHEILENEPPSREQEQDDVLPRSQTQENESPSQEQVNVLRRSHECQREMTKIVSVEPLKPYHKQTDYDQSEMFTATIRVNLRDKEEACQWLSDFKESSFSDWRVRRCYPENTKCLIWKKGYRCNHNTLAQYRESKPHVKHTECDAYISITVKNLNMKRSADKLLKTFPCEIILHNCHNHPIHASDALRHRRPTSRITDIFLELYRKDHSPSSALSTHKYDLQVKHPKDWFEVLADGAECPNLQWCYHLYRKTFLKEYGPSSGQGMLKSLSEAIDKYNAEVGSVCAIVETCRGDDLIIAFCSPLMKRVHQHLKSSGEINFLDSGGSMDRHNSRIFTFLAPSVAGALPLGMIITSSESEDVLSEGMRLLKSILPPDAFYGRGPDRGPEVIMTDDSKSERNSLENSWPGIILLLCFFHVLQAFWTYIWDSKHKVDAKDKEEVFFIFKTWCYSETLEEFEDRYQAMLSNPLICNNSLLVKHINGFTRLESYFERRIAAVVNNRRENYWSSKHYITPSKLEPLHCAESSKQHIYLVKNAEKQTTYTVDMQLEICSYPVGKNGAPCKHQYAVVKRFNLSTSQFLPYEDEAAKAVLHQIMTTAPVKPGWYAHLKTGPATPNGKICSTSENSPREILDEEEFQDDITSSTTTEIEVPLVTSESSLNEAQARAFKVWESINLFISNGLKEKPDVFVSAVEKFGSQFNKGRALSENSVLSAMHTFSINSFGAKASKRGRYIKVNNAAMIRRKYASLGGRKCTQQGRPAKAAFTAEHGYSASRNIVPSWNRCSQRKGPVPHNLSVRIQQQVARNRKK
ncbi:hypothetical protein ONE63_011443 [Megalurothrips usitatus]|uniref:SWIM-type domain-containing protein n=1 Tax=Megalurothrips usitatus TaxID=439358 RepID=A0AAV7X5P9_9NEOP|nr:hypothetical protein ONE63_011443 [Megalurothrips usitatus]